MPLDVQLQVYVKCPIMDGGVERPATNHELLEMFRSVPPYRSIWEGRISNHFIEGCKHVPVGEDGKNLYDVLWGADNDIDASSLLPYWAAGLLWLRQNRIDFVPYVPKIGGVWETIVTFMWELTWWASQVPGCIIHKG